MTSVLVTGSSGYVGSHTVKYLAVRGFRVVGLDLVPPASPLKRYCSANRIGDIADEGLAKFMKEQKVLGVVHCAAKCLVGESVEQPELYHDHNYARAACFAQSAVRAGVERLVFSSTAAVYGEAEKLPISEDHPRKPINPYGESKKKFEDLLQEMEKHGDLKVGIFRYFNAAGADPDAEIGESHDPETHLVPNAILAALGRKSVFKIFGADYPTRDGTCERDYVHVWDLAAAHLLLLEKLKKDARGDVFNLGTGGGYTVKEVLDEIDRQSPRKVPRSMAPRRPGDPAVLVADPAKAARELGWKAHFSTLEKIVETALRWHVQPLAC